MIFYIGMVMIAVGIASLVASCLCPDDSDCIVCKIHTMLTCASIGIGAVLMLIGAIIAVYWP